MSKRDLEREALIARVRALMPPSCCNLCDFFSGNREGGVTVRPAWCCNPTSPLYKKNIDESEVHDCFTDDLSIHSNETLEMLERTLLATRE